MLEIIFFKTSNTCAVERKKMRVDPIRTVTIMANSGNCNDGESDWSMDTIEQANVEAEKSNTLSILR